MADQSNHTLITDDDHGAILAIVTWCLGCALIFAVALRIGTRILSRNGLNLDDLCITIAVAFSIGNIVIVSLAVQAGLGKRFSGLNINRVEEIRREVYVTNILYVMTIGLSKLSVTAFLYRLSCFREHRICVLLLTVSISCWSIASTAVIIFACGMMQPWGFGRDECIEAMSFWTSSSAIDVSTDIAMILLPIKIVSGLDIKAQKKAVVMFIFTLRIFLSALSLVRVVLLRASNSPTADLSFDSIPLHIIAQAHAILSIILACGPAFKPFLHNIRASILSSRLSKHKTPSSAFKNDQHNPLDDLSRSPQSNKSRMVTGESLDELHFAPYGYETKITAQCVPATISNTNERNNFTPSPAWNAQFDAYPFTSIPDFKMHIPPRRPPPPPEELRPDLSMFRPRVLLKGQHPDWAIGIQERFGRISEESDKSDERLSNKTGYNMKF